MSFVGGDVLILRALRTSLRQFVRLSLAQPCITHPALLLRAFGAAPMPPPGLNPTSLRRPAAAQPFAAAANAAPEAPFSFRDALLGAPTHAAAPKQPISRSVVAAAESWRGWANRASTGAAPTLTVPFASPAQRRSLSTVAEAIAKAQQEAGRISTGHLVQFKGNGNAWLLGWVRGPSAKSGDYWEIEDDSGAVRTVRETDIAFAVPGGLFVTVLPPVAAEAAQKEAAAQLENLIELAWEVSEPGALYSVDAMAELLFATASPGAMIAAHRLFCRDRLYFKQVGRHPPMYSVRPVAEVKSMQVAAKKARAAAGRLEEFVAAAAAARAQKRREKPTHQAWMAGPHSDAVRSIEAFALGKPAPVGPDPGGGSGAAKVGAAAALQAAGIPRTPQGAAELLQGIGFWPPHVQLGLLTNGLTPTFESLCEAAAEQLVRAPPPDPDAARRADLTGLHVVTIDDESTAEIDDGLSAEVLPGGGGVKVWVHIADPTRWVSLADVLDFEARRRTRTLYLPTGMVPMFPLQLAAGPFSLRAEEPSCALTVSCIVDANGNVALENVHITPSLVLPTQRMTYDSADDALAAAPAKDEYAALHALAAAAAARRAFRLSAGAVEISMPEMKVEVQGLEEDVPSVRLMAESGGIDCSPSRQMVAEMMILAGELSARVGATMGVPLPFRGQMKPIMPPADEIERVPAGPCRMALLRGTMTRSITAVDAPQPHAGLGLEAYAQVTSPIRRYGDLVAHWQLKAALRGDDPPLTAPALAALLEEVGTQGQRVSKLERDAQSYWVARYFQAAAAADSEATWAALFLGWYKQEAGLARVLLEELGLESLVKVTRPARPGTKLIVRCSSADPMLGMFRLEEVWTLTRE